MPTDPKDNKGGDLAEIKDLASRKVPKPTVTQRRNKWTKESDTQALARQSREDVDKTRLVNDSRSKFKQKSIDTLKSRADAWAAQEKADIESGAKKPPLNSKEKAMTDKKEYTDFSSQKNFKPNMPAAAESRMKANKPLKTALVREVEPGRNRGKLAAEMQASRKAGTAREDVFSAKTPDEVRSSVASENARIDRRFQSAAETGEAQAFVGKMKPGVAARTQAHTEQSREYQKPPAAPGKDLGRAVTNTIRRETGAADGGNLMKMAKQRQAASRSIAGPDPSPPVAKNRSIIKRGKGGAGAAPDLREPGTDLHSAMGKTTFDDPHFPKKLTID